MRRLIKDEFTDLPVSRQRKYQLRMQKKNRCTICGEAAVTSSYCLKHAVRYREVTRKKLKLRRRYHKALSYALETLAGGVNGQASSLNSHGTRLAKIAA